MPERLTRKLSSLQTMAYEPFMITIILSFLIPLSDFFFLAVSWIALLFIAPSSQKRRLFFFVDQLNYVVKESICQ